MASQARGKSRHQAQKRRIVRKVRSTPRQIGQAIVVRSPGPKPWELSIQETDILKNAICKGASDTEFQYCLAVARRFRLDPFQQQIWFVPRRDRDAQVNEGQRGGKVYVPVVGINGLLHVAARDHQDFGSYAEIEYGPMVTVTYQKLGKGPVLKFQAPEWARVEAYKKGDSRPTVGKVWWSEIYPNIDYSPVVREKPRHMLGKCAKANATRTAYPSTGGLLIKEETYGREFSDITPEGRLIVREPEPVNAYEQRYLEREKEALGKMTPAQREVFDRKMSAGAEPRRADTVSGGTGTRNAIEADPVTTSRSAEMPTVPIPCLFYTHYPESDTYRIDGPQELKTANKDLLGPLCQRLAGQIVIVATPAQLGKLLSKLEERKVPIRALERA